MLASLPAAPVPARDYPMVAEPALSSACDSQLRKRKRLSLPPTPPLAADDAGHDCKRLKSFCVEPDCCDHVGEIVDADGDEGDGGDGNDVGNGDGDSDKESGDEDDKFLHRATRVLNSAVASLALTTRLYESDRRARRSLRRAITIIADATSSAARTLPRSPTSDGSGSKGKLLVSGVGKSGHIARKAAATAASVGVRSIFLNAAEAVHGDLGYVSEVSLSFLFLFQMRLCACESVGSR